MLRIGYYSLKKNLFLVLLILNTIVTGILGIYICICYILGIGYMYLKDICLMSEWWQFFIPFTTLI